MTESEKMELTSMDVAEEKREELKRCLGSAFPEIFTEDAIDFDQLRRVLGDWVEPGKERFGLNWPGKAACMKIIQQPSVATLKPVREESINFDETENLFIEGDNLEVLKLLQKAYFGKIKMIYIDPPYNTGNDFIYPDKYSETLETYLAYTGQIDAKGRKFSTTTETTGRYHSRWLNMVYPRLYMARNLLTDDGVIFISIDDSELNSLKKLCDELFGEDNFIANFIWEKRTNRENRKMVSSRHDYVLCYCKDNFSKEKIIRQLPMSEKALANYKNPDNDPRGRWKSDPATAQAGHGTKSQFYVYKAPNGKEHHLQSGRCWLYTKEVLEEAAQDGRIWFGKDGNGVPRVKTYLEAKDRGLTPETIWFSADASTNEFAKNQLKELFDGTAVFETPKPVDLIQLAMELSAEDGIVLDFFAGSCPTAEAALKRNMGNQFIMVQLPEPCPDKSEAYKAGYETIADIGKERIRRVIRRATEEQQGELALDAAINADHGFKVFRLDQSNFKVWNGNADAFDEGGRQLEAHVDHLSHESKAEDVLYELLLKSGFPLTTNVNQLTLVGKQVFSIEEGVLLICLENEITPELIDALAEAGPLQVICLDAAFKGNDQLKANAVQTFKVRAQADESEIVFKTV